MSDLIVRQYPRGDISAPELPTSYGKSDPLHGINPKATLRVVSDEIVGDFHLLTARNGPGSYGNMPTLYAVTKTSDEPFRPDAILDVILKGIELVPGAGGFRKDQPARLMVLEVL